MTAELFSLEGRVALVAGGNGGLGRTMALGLSAAGATVVVTGRDATKNAAAANELGKDAVEELDVRDEVAVEHVVGRHGRLDVLVNNAGALHGHGALRMTRADWDATIETDLSGAYLCARHAARTMIDGDRGGTILNIASIYGQIGTRRFPTTPRRRPDCSVSPGRSPSSWRHMGSASTRSFLASTTPRCPARTSPPSAVLRSPPALRRPLG